MVVKTDWGPIMKKTDEEYFNLMESSCNKEDRKEEGKNKDRNLVSVTLDMLRDVRSQWIEAENYQYGKSRRRID